MRRPILIGALVAAALLAGAASGSRAVGAECPGGGFTPAWSPNGQEIAWSTSSGDGICFARPDGTHERLLRLPARLERPTELLWARLGVLVALSHSGHIFSISTRPRPHLMRSGRGFWGTGRGSFSLDSSGDVLATGSGCSSSCAGPVRILRAGGASTLVGDGAYANVEPSLSPDGRRVVFTKEAANGSGKSLGIWTGRTDGTHLHEIESSGRCPLWSPGGKRIAYVDGGLVVAPTTGGAGFTLTTAVGTCGAPQSIVWSPDSQRIAFVDSANHLSVLHVRVTHPWRVAFSRDLHGLAWHPSSWAIFFSADNARGCRSLWQVEVDGKRTTRVSRC